MNTTDVLVLGAFAWFAYLLTRPQPRTYTSQDIKLSGGIPTSFVIDEEDLMRRLHRAISCPN